MAVGDAGMTPMRLVKSARLGSICAVGATIEGCFHTWFGQDESGSLDPKKAKKFEAAMDELFANSDLAFGFDAGVQGWGGSPAINLFVMIPECHVAYPLFLGITHD